MANEPKLHSLIFDRHIYIRMDGMGECAGNRPMESTIRSERGAWVRFPAWEQFPDEINSAVVTLITLCWVLFLMASIPLACKILHIPRGLLS